MTEQSEDLISRLDDTLVDLRALVKIVLFVSETCDGDDFKMLKSEFNTMFYMMIDKVDVCSDVSFGLCDVSREDAGAAH